MIAISCATARAQRITPASPPQAAQPETQPDPLGRTTPRGTVLGFLTAAREGKDQIAAQYLDTTLSGKAAADLAHKLFVVLDRRLPARLNELSDRPEGSPPFFSTPDEDLVGTVVHGSEKMDILVERVARGKSPVWLFSRKTLVAIPAVFAEVSEVSIEQVLPAVLVDTRIAHVALYEWLGVFGGLPLLYILTSLLSRLCSPWMGRLRRRLWRDSELPNPVVLPQPARLLLMALIIWWMLSEISLPLLARQLWAGTASTLTIGSCVWLVIRLNRRGEELVRRRLEKLNNAAAQSILRLGRRMIDLLAIFVGLLITLRYFGVNPTAALAGLGVGGIAVALAAQKTLENVIGGISIIFDHAVRVGDLLNTGSTSGVVESTGLRSTRIRTSDRTVVIVPNGQLANAQLENLSLRDTFWFHPNVCLHHETTADAVRSIVGTISLSLGRHALVDRDSFRVRFFRLGPSSLDIEIFAYVLANDWPHFLEIQEDLLLQVMKIVEAAGARLAFPAQQVAPLAANSGFRGGLVRSETYPAIGSKPARTERGEGVLPQKPATLT